MCYRKDSHCPSSRQNLTVPFLWIGFAPATACFLSASVLRTASPAPGLTGHAKGTQWNRSTAQGFPNSSDPQFARSCIDAMLASGLPDTVADDEDLARLLTQSNHFNTQVAKPAAFLPQSSSKNTSLSRHGRAPLDDLKALGTAAAGARKLYGAAMLKAADVRRAALAVESSEPPLRHAVVVGWPWNDADPELQKAKQKEMALLLCSAAGPPLIF